MQLIVLIITIFGYTNAFPTPTLKDNVIWVRPTQPVVPAVKKRRIKDKIHAKITFQDQLTTKDQSHSPPTVKFRLRSDNSTTSPTSGTGCRRIQVKSMKS